LTSHLFLLGPGEWVGEGEISFAEASDRLRFSARWTVHPESSGVISATQKIEVEGVAEKMENEFAFTDFEGERFAVELDNQLLGCVYGNGLVEGSVIGWEFRANEQQGVEGFEIYELQEDGSYSVRAEYVSTDQFRTIIEGKLRAAATASS